MLPDLALLLVGGNMGVQVMTKEHISIACALQIPLAVVVTKVDIAPEVSTCLSCLCFGGAGHEDGSPSIDTRV